MITFINASVAVTLFAFSVVFAGCVKYGLEAAEELGFLRLQLCEKEHFLQVLYQEPRIE